MKANCKQFHCYSKGVYIPAHAIRCPVSEANIYIPPPLTSGFDIRLASAKDMWVISWYIWLEALRATAPFNQSSSFSPLSWYTCPQ